ncbi:hypothetical protein CC80DRAFT_372134, partial [Byssothecium circinans]
DLPDEELPGYDEPAPEYSVEANTTALHTYHLRQVDRKLQLFVPYGPSASVSYKVTTRSARLFSKKAEMDVWRTVPSIKREEHVASVWFDNDGPLPWRPRAHFIHGSSSHAMESRNFSDWSIVINGTTYAWVFVSHPSCYLVLHEPVTDEVIARFNFSARGTTAHGGAEAGNLTIHRRHAVAAEGEGVEKILCALIVTLANFKKMGRHYKN